MAGIEDQLSSLSFKPGINRNTTRYDADPYFLAGAYTRFRQGKPESMGGWTKRGLSGTLVGTPRNSLIWSSNEGKAHEAIATHSKLEIIVDQVITDITPIISTTTVAGPASTVNGSNQITCNVSAPDVQEGDYVLISSATSSINGIPWNGAEYKVTTKIDTSHFILTAGVNANASGSGLGGSTTFSFLLPSGNKDAGTAYGWGAGSWNTPGATLSSGWNDPRGGSGVGQRCRTWSLANFGQDLVACYTHGPLIRWVAATGTSYRAVLVSAAPDTVDHMIAAPETRQIILAGTKDSLGNYDPLLIRWCSSEDLSDWTATNSNNAGSFRLSSGSYIVGMVNTNKERLIFTDKTVYSMTFTGSDTVWSFEPIANNVDLISPGSIVDVNGTVYWMGKNNFYRYTGRIEALISTLDEAYLDTRGEYYLNMLQKDKIYVGVNTLYNEVCWLVPTGSNLEPNRAIFFNYVDEIWYDTPMDRSIWTDRGIYDHPIAWDSNGNSYDHENTEDADAQEMPAFLETSYLHIGEGDDLMLISMVIPDIDIEGQLDFYLKARKYPNGPEIEKGPYPVDNTTKMFKPRVKGRQIALKVQKRGRGSSFEFGGARIGMHPFGRK